MSNKAFKDLNILDSTLRKTFPSGMRTGSPFKIEKICGFELFNTRPYHNYETFSDGYKITVYPREPSKIWALESDNRGLREIIIEEEDLDDAIKRLEFVMNNLSICGDCNYFYFSNGTWQTNCVNCRKQQQYQEKMDNTEGCKASRDGEDCFWKKCPQKINYQNSCPLIIEDEDY